MTKRQSEQFNKMLATLRRISTGYQTPAQLRRASLKDFGLGFEEAIEYAYENIQGEAKAATRNVKPIAK